MILMTIDKESLCGKTYIKFVEYLLNNADTFTFLFNEDFDTKYPNIKSVFTNRYGITKGSGMHVGVSKVNADILRSILLKFSSVDEWDSPGFFEDLYFFKGDKCIFASVYHEDIFLMYEEDNNTLEKIKKTGIVFNECKESEKYRPVLPR